MIAVRSYGVAGLGEPGEVRDYEEPLPVLRLRLPHLNFSGACKAAGTFARVELCQEPTCSLTKSFVGIGEPHCHDPSHATEGEPKSWESHPQIRRTGSKCLM
jgi:hypothetical protein